MTQPKAVEEPTDERPMPTNVVAALARVMEDLPAIGKGGKADPSQGGYAYRGIEQITKEAQALFARYGVVAVPYVDEVEIVDITVNNKPWTDTRTMTTWKIYGPGGIEDMIEARTAGIGRDNSDKGANKAATGAFKYLLLPMLMIADAKDDTDGSTHEGDSGTSRGSRSGSRRQAAPPPADPISAEQFAELQELIRSIDNKAWRDEVAVAFNERFGAPKTLPADRFDGAVRFIKARAASAPTETGPGDGPPPPPPFDESEPPTSQQGELT